MSLYKNCLWIFLWKPVYVPNWRSNLEFIEWFSWLLLVSIFYSYLHRVQKDSPSFLCVITFICSFTKQIKCFTINLFQMISMKWQWILHFEKSGDVGSVFLYFCLYMHFRVFIAATVYTRRLCLFWIFSFCLN